MDFLQPQQVYSNEEKAELIISAIKANHECGDLRKNFNLCNAKIPNVYVNPEFCELDAKNLIDCFQNVRRNVKKICTSKFEEAKACLMNNKGCSMKLDAYFNCDSGMSQ